RLDVRYCGVRADRHEAVVVVLVGRSDGLRRAGETGLDGCTGVRREARRIGRVRVTGSAQPAPEVGAGLGEALLRVPGDLQLCRRLNRVVLLRSDDSDEVGDLHDLSARDVADRA